MKFHLILVTLFLVHSVSGQGFRSWLPFNSDNEKAETEVVIKTGTHIPPRPAYQPIVKEVKKDDKKMEKHEPKKYIEKCNVTFTKEDILMLSILRKDPYTKPSAFPPILLPPETIRFSFRIEKKKELISFALLKKVAKAAKTGHEDKLPIALMLDPKTATLLPLISHHDIVILTIITKDPKKGLKLKSHFVDSIFFEQPVKSSYY